MFPRNRFYSGPQVPAHGSRFRRTQLCRPSTSPQLPPPVAPFAIYEVASHPDGTRARGLCCSLRCHLCTTSPAVLPPIEIAAIVTEAEAGVRVSQTGQQVTLRYNHYKHELTIGEGDALQVSEIKELFAFDYGFRVSRRRWASFPSPAYKLLYPLYFTLCVACVVVVVVVVVVGALIFLRTVLNLPVCELLCPLTRAHTHTHTLPLTWALHSAPL